MIYGAVLGDYIGSRFEFNNIKTKNFELFHEDCDYTDDTIMTLAIREACEKIKIEGYEIYEQAEQYFIEAMQKWGRSNPNPKGAYGNSFYHWLFSDDPKPYNSWGNGSAMRVSACGWMFNSLEEVEKIASWSAKPTHNYPEGIKGAKVTAGCIYIARTTKDKEKVREYAEQYYELEPCDKVRPTYKFEVSCQGTMPVAIECFLESTDFEDAIRTAISMGGDSDTIGAITGSIAEAFYDIPEYMKVKADEIIQQVTTSHKQDKFILKFL